ncbi:MAG TPA: apolipoprotein N-acyltransferase [Candidatus Sulfotelmatobacter sp.]|nr:apolipoprotein N-acyltransferase [Candidatus Sulfotelmatobacter sp.]
MLRIQPSAWGLILLSAALQVVIFPLAGLYWLSWVAVAPLLVAILRARAPDTLQLDDHRQARLPATPWQGFVLGYACGILWLAGSCYWIFDTMRHYGGLPTPAAALALISYCMYIGLYCGMFGLVLALIAGSKPGSKSAGTKPSNYGASIRRALAAAPFLWVAMEFARSRTSPDPWEMLGYSQTGNFALTRFATLAGVYGLSFEIVLVNSVFAAAFLVIPEEAGARQRRKWLLVAASVAAVILQAGQWMAPPAVSTDHTALLLQPDIPVQDGAQWTKEYFQDTLRDLTALSLHPAGAQAGRHIDLIVWPESPSPFYTNDPLFRDAVSALAKQSGTWVVAGAIGITPAMHNGGDSSQIFNSAALISPQGEWVGRYDKVHLVPFGEYLPFPQLFAFAGGLTKEVGEFQRGASRTPLQAGNERVGTFICYESMFPDEVRQFPLAGAEVLVNISNDGWYGDSGAWKEHLQETRMRAIENGQWLLAGTNTGMTASIDPYGRIVAATPRNVRTTLAAPYALSASTTFYTRHGGWFACLCAIISAGALLARFGFPDRER